MQKLDDGPDDLSSLLADAPSVDPADAPAGNAAGSDDYDTPWKDVIQHAFPEFMAFYFPDAARRIDWAAGHEFLETELRQVVRDAELGRRHADLLVRVTSLGGQTEHVYVHVEVQGGRERDFARRMFVYHYRLFDRFDATVASLAVLADDDPLWRPDRFTFEAAAALARCG